MDRIFYKKTTSILFVAAILLVMVLVCMLLINLIQYSSLTHRADDLVARIAKAQTDEEYLNQLLADKDTIEWVMKWAEEHGRISQNDVLWVQENVLK